MDIGTINLLNKISKKGPLLPKNIRFIHKNTEVLDEGEVASEDQNGPQERGRAGASATGDAHDPTSVLEEAVQEDKEYRIIGPEDTYSTVANSDEALDNTPPPITRRERRGEEIDAS
jgi:hypothetical protein